MKLSEEQLEIIHKYLSNSLKSSEEQLFNSFLKDDTFRSELLYQAQMLDALTELDYLSLRSELQNSDNITITKERKKSGSNKNWLWFLILAVLLVLFYFGYKAGSAANESVTFVQLAQAYNVVYPPAIVVRGASAELSEAYVTAMKSYANSDWTTAIRELQAISPSTDEIKLYLSNSMIQMRQYDEALAVLDEIAAGDKNLQNKEWYQIICYLGLDRAESAITLTEKIAADKTHIFNARSNKLLSELK